MTKEQAEIQAKALNGIVKGKTTYMAHPMEPTRWEKDRWAVVQLYGEAAYPLNVVGVART